MIEVQELCYDDGNEPSWSDIWGQRLYPHKHSTVATSLAKFDEPASALNGWSGVE
jgi:hypothetical protein